MPSGKRSYCTSHLDLSEPVVRDFILKTLPAHASTRERIPILPRFFAEVLADIEPVHSVLDLACGLNPLAIPWMPLAEGFRYTACDIYMDMTGFLNSFFQKFKIDGEAIACDLTQEIPGDRGRYCLRPENHSLPGTGG